MSCTFSQETIENVIAFHGHSCPGLAIGIRAAEFAGKELPDTDPADLLCITETDMCGVDAIQFLTGCTFGKGNLIHRDYGKAAFTFYDRSRQDGFRIVFNDEATAAEQGDMSRLMAKSKEGSITLQEKEQLADMRQQVKQRLMDASLETLFRKTELVTPIPRAARVLQGLLCEECNEKTMESRTRRFAGKTLCIPCFEKVEQKA